MKANLGAGLQLFLYFCLRLSKDNLLGAALAAVPASRALADVCQTSFARLD